jgi:hypothetical protein
MQSRLQQPSSATVVPLPIYASPSPTSGNLTSDFGFIHISLDPEHAEAPPTQSSESEDINDKTPPVPVMLPSSKLGHIQLVLDEPMKLYSPSDAITGYILGWTPATHIYVILEGKAKTHIRTDKADYLDHAPLLYQVVHLNAEDQNLIPRF